MKALHVLRKPCSEGTVAENVLRWGTGAINVDGCRVEGVPPSVPQPSFSRNMRAGFGASEGRNGEMSHAQGRWPANLIHDGSDEATEGLRDAARYFYTAKADRTDRDEVLGNLPTCSGAQAVERAEGSAGTASSVVNHHPTVKPTDLMRYLVRMVTPVGGTVLDPFAGSGSTGRAAMLEGMRFIGCELSPEYAEIARARIRFTLGPLFAHEVT